MPLLLILILRSKLINKAVPGTIDERVLNINPSTAEAVMENLNLLINSAKSIGCNMNDITFEDIITGNVGLTNLCALTRPRR
jgi:plastin-1